MLTIFFIFRFFRLQDVFQKSLLRNRTFYSNGFIYDIVDSYKPKCNKSGVCISDFTDLEMLDSTK